MTKEQIKFIVSSPVVFAMMLIDDFREAVAPKVRDMREMYDHLGDQGIGSIDEELTDLDKEIEEAEEKKYG